jgi:hypothetical protein
MSWPGPVSEKFTSLLGILGSTLQHNECGVLACCARQILLSSSGVITELFAFYVFACMSQNKHK